MHRFLSLLSIVIFAGCAVAVTPSIPPADGGADATAKNDAGAKDAAKTDAADTTDAGDTTDASAVDANDAAQAACPGYALPSESASCHACTLQTNPNCQPNGCYGGYYCELATTKCAQKPSGC